MHTAHLKRILSILLLFSWMIASTQQDKLPLDAWTRDLSVKVDDLSLKFESIQGQLALLDSTKRCDALSQLDDWAHRGNTRLKIRVALLRAH